MVTEVGFEPTSPKRGAIQRLEDHPEDCCDSIFLSVTSATRDIEPHKSYYKEPQSAHTGRIIRTETNE